MFVVFFVNLVFEFFLKGDECLCCGVVFVVGVVKVLNDCFV